MAKKHTHTHTHTHTQPTSKAIRYHHDKTFTVILQNFGALKSSWYTRWRIAGQSSNFCARGHWHDPSFYAPSTFKCRCRFNLGKSISHWNYRTIPKNCRITVSAICFVQYLGNSFIEIKKKKNTHALKKKKRTRSFQPKLVFVPGSLERTTCISICTTHNHITVHTPVNLDSKVLLTNWRLVRDTERVRPSHRHFFSFLHGRCPWQRWRSSW